MKTELEALTSGEMTIDQFFRETRLEWEKLGVMLMRRWQVPDGVELPDVVQELMLAAWTALPKYDPKRGAPLKGFVVYNAVDKAAKWMHRQRDAKRREGRSPGRYPIALSAVRTRDAYRWRDSRLRTDPSEAVEARLDLMAQVRRRPPLEAAVLALVLDQGFEAAVDALEADGLYLILHRLDSRQAVSHHVRGIIANALLEET